MKKRKGLGFSRMENENFPFDKDLDFQEKGRVKIEERKKEEKYERYECRVCGNIIETDPLKVPQGL